MKTTLKYLLLLLTICFFPYSSSGQEFKVDSLYSLLKADKEDTNKIKHLNDLGWELMYDKPDTSIILGQQALALCEQLQSKYNTSKLRASAYGNMGVYYLLKADYPKALDFYFKALKINESLNNKKGIASNLGNIGIIYKLQGDYSKALEYYTKVLKIGEEFGDKNIIATQFGNIGNVYYNQENYTKALEYYLNALKINEELGNKKHIAAWLGNIGSVYSGQKDYDKALDYYMKALQMKKEIGNKNEIAITLTNIGSVYTSIKKYDLAEKHLEEALKISREVGIINQELDIEYNFTELYEITGREKLALYHYKKAMAIKDTLFNAEKEKDITGKALNYEFEKREAAVKAEQDKKDVIAAEEKNRQKIITYSIGAGFILVLLLALFIYNGYRQKQKANIIITEQKQEVEKKNQIIEEKNKNITDSINYSKRIQQAKLPKKEDILASLPQSFVLFKPKDIVSGDFYFFHKNEHQVFIACADCTGHGVPGALMSMIGSEKLSDAISESSDTSEILKLLNKGIKTSLRQSENSESSRDGMDISLCSIDIKKRIVNYAGANRPLWIIRNGQTTLDEIKATKKAIGGFTENEQHFDSHELLLNPGDTFYLTTDGYADQFNGKTGKKLMTKKLKEILLSIQSKTMKEQEAHLDKFINDWKEGSEQVDDILVIGIRL